MREIKFRAWDKKRKIMITLKTDEERLECYGDSLYSREEWWPWYDIRFLNGPYILQKEYGDRLVIMQFTGLKDKNGREIYEGDIIKAEGLISIRIRPVIFQNGMFCIPGECALLPLSEYVGEGNELEVIGNIYENPELLEGESNGVSNSC